MLRSPIFIRVLSQRQLVFILVLVSQIVFSQKKDENIGTEVVNVVKPYSPTISDAFKVKEAPSFLDDDTSKRESISYSIFSFPVASTFVPSKGKAENVEKEKQARGYKNYATLGFGNYATLNTSLFVTENLSDHEVIGGMFRHLSSQGGIKEVVLNDNFLTTSLDLSYANQQENSSWISDLGFQNQLYNWYGIPSDIAISVIGMINPCHSYNHFYAGTKVKFREGVVQDAALKYNRFWDSYGSVENRFFAKPSIEFGFARKKIKTVLSLDYLKGALGRNDAGGEANLYGITNFGVQPSFIINKDNWAIKVGASLFYSLDSKHSNSKLFVYPDVTASLKVVGDYMIFYSGLTGGLENNSYRDFTNENPFISPNLGVPSIVPTNMQYDFFAGLKGKLANSVNYTLKGTYKCEKNKSLFKHNEYNLFGLNDNYQYGNSFSVVYDNIRTLSFYGEIKADLSKKVAFGINGTFSNFSTTNQKEAWNLPTLKMGSNLSVSIAKKWKFSSEVFYIGERKEFLQISFEPAFIEGVQTLKSYFDANINLEYRYSDRLSGFLKCNNLTNNRYQKWVSYPVQGLQVVLGANYKFDF
jgi:hypothetical protein